MVERVVGSENLGAGRGSWWMRRWPSVALHGFAEHLLDLAAVALNPRCQGLISLCKSSVQSFPLNSFDQSIDQ